MKYRNKIKESIEEARPIPTGKEFDNLHDLYKVVPTSQLESYVHAFDRKLSKGYDDGYNRGYGKCYGEGVYLNIGLDAAMETLRQGGYGDCILQVKLLGGFKNYLFFNRSNPKIAKLCSEVYGTSNISVRDQLYQITNDWSIASTFATEDPGTFGNDYQKKIMRAGYYVRGIVYNWGWGGNHPVALPFNFGDVITYKAATNLDRYGTTKQEIIDKLNSKEGQVFNDESRKSQSEWLDTIPQMLLMNAAKEQMPYHRCALDGCVYVAYEKHGGGMHNLVMIDEDNIVEPKPKFVLPTDVNFTSVSVPGDDGIFYFSVDDVDFTGFIRHPKIDAPVFYWEPSNDWYPMSMLKDAVKIKKSQKVACESVRLANKRMLEEAFRPDMSAAEFYADNPRIIYVCAHANSVDGIFKNGFSRQFANDNDKYNNGGSLTYGDGQYGSMSLDNAANNLALKTSGRNSDGSKYGKVILRCILIGGLERFLIFDEKVAKSVYGQNWQIMDQIDTIIQDPVGRNELKNFTRQFLHKALYNPKDDVSGRTNHVIFNMFSDSDGFKRWSEFFCRHGVRGCVYHGHGDGFCLICYNYSEIIPIAASYDFGKTFTNEKFNWDRVRDRLSYDNDVKSKIGYAYKTVSKFAKRIDCNGKIFGLTIVETKMGKWNLVFQDGQKLSKFDFDIQPVVYNDGMLEFEYNGIEFRGIADHPVAHIPAFYFEPNGTWQPFDLLDEAARVIKQQK